MITKISQDTGIEEATLEELFGDSSSYCKCDHESSVYSAAAYFCAASRMCPQWIRQTALPHLPALSTPATPRCCSW